MDIENIKNETKGATIVAATKYVNSEKMRELLECNINNFGENRVDSFLEKYNDLKNEDIIWHFIGHLQRNKAKLVVDKIDYLHSLDSLELAKIIDSLRVSPLKCFIEVKLSDSKTKSGITKDNLETFLLNLKEFKNIEVIGLMAMTEKDMTENEKYNMFREVKTLGNKYGLNEFSMGMSEDYKDAIKAGSTFVRLGRILFN